MYQWLLAGVLTFSLCGLVAAKGQEHEQNPAPDQSTAATKISSQILFGESGGRTLLQEVTVAAPVDEVWNAYTTSEGWMAWAVPQAEANFVPGGSIRTAYEGEVGDPGTITLQIVNFVPHRVLTLQTDVQENWPEFMQEDADRLYNIILFTEVGENQTRIESYGVGYGNSPQYENLLQYFNSANKTLMANLKRYVETGERKVWQ